MFCAASPHEHHPTGPNSLAWAHLRQPRPFAIPPDSKQQCWEGSGRPLGLDFVLGIPVGRLGELQCRFKNTCFYKTDGQGNYGHNLGNILKMWDILRDILTFWDMGGTSCRTSCGTFSHFGTSWGHLAGHLAGHSHISGHLGTSCGTSCGTFSHFGTSRDILRDILRDIWWGRPETKTFSKTFCKTF